MKKLEAASTDLTRSAIKRAAQRLFAVHGIDGVSTREIIAEAGQRNSGAVHYYFGTLDNLLKELVVDGAKPLDERRIEAINQLERSGGPWHVRDLIEILVLPLTEGGPDEQGYLRFLQAMAYGHRREFLDAIEGKWNIGYQRCLTHLRRLLPDIPRTVLNQRFIFMDILIGSAMAKREFFVDGGHPSRLWDAQHTLENLIDSIQAMLEAPVSDQTRSMIGLRA